MRPLLVLRPEPGAAATFARALAAGFRPIAAPIFEMVPVAWEPPAAEAFDALMLTSANAVRHAGAALHSYRALRTYAVGSATAAAAIQAGFADVRTGAAGAAALAATMADEGVRRVLHLCGRDRVESQEPFSVERRIVYAADPVAALPAAARAGLERDAIALVHSPRAARTLADLLVAAGIEPATVSIAAISEAAAVGVWKEVAIAASPDDAALLAAASTLCEKG